MTNSLSVVIAAIFARSASLLLRALAARRSEQPGPQRGSHAVIPAIRPAMAPWLLAALAVVCIAGAAVAFLVYPAYAQDEDEPLTAGFLENTGPTNHEGDGHTFTIRIRFSEDIATSYEVLRDQALQVDGGEARKFKRVDGSNSLWEIHAEPDSDADVTLTLPETTDCEAADAVCTEGGKPLSQRVSITIPGPAPEPTPTPTPTPTPEPEPAPESLAPSGLTVQVTDGGIGLSWEAPEEDADSVTGYRIQRAVGDGELATLVENTGNVATSYTDTAATQAGETYAYQVSALRSEEQSQDSNRAEARIPYDPAGLAPTTLVAEIVDGGVSLNWDAPAADADSVTGYRILRALGDGELTTLVADTGNANTAYTDATATRNGETYGYQVRALRDGEQSEATDRAEVEIPTDPLAPSGLTAELVDADVSLNWEAPVEDAASVTGYQVSREWIKAGQDGNAHLHVDRMPTGGTATTWADSDIPRAGVTYAYRVRADRDGSTSGWSNETRVEYPELEATAVPTGGTPTPPEDDPVALPAHATKQILSASLTVARLDATANRFGFTTGNGQLSQTRLNFEGSAYDIRGVSVDPENGLLFTLDRPLGLFDLQNLVLELGQAEFDLADAHYVFDSQSGRWSYQWTKNVPSWSAGQTVALKILGIACQPRRFTLTPGYTPGIPGSAYITLRWAAPDDCGSAITGYRIEVSTDGGRNWTNLVANTRSVRTSHTDRNLTGGQLRHYRVTPINSGNDGSASAVKNRLVPVDRSYYEGEMTLGEVVVGQDVFGHGYSRVVGSLLPQPAALSVEEVEYTIVNIRHLLTGSLALWVRPIPPSDVDFVLILDGEKFFTSDVEPQLFTDEVKYEWRTDILSWTNEQQVAVKLQPTQKKKSHVWVANLSVGVDSGSSGYFADEIGSVTPNSFIVRDPNLSYLVYGTYYSSSARSMYLTLSPDFPSDFDLYLPGERYSSKDATKSTRTEGEQYTWTLGADETTYISADWQDVRVSIAAELDFLPEESVPSAPTGLTATVGGTSSISLSWSAPGADGGLPVMGYQVEVSTGPGDRTWTVAPGGHNVVGTFYEHTDLEPGSDRRYRVRARNLLGVGEPSQVATATTDQDENCDIYCATATVRSLVGENIGVALNPDNPVGSVDRNKFTLSDTEYTLSGLVNAITSTFSGVTFGTGSSLPPESAVEGLSLYVGGVELPF